MTQSNKIQTDPIQSMSNSGTEITLVVLLLKTLLFAHNVTSALQIL